MATTGEDPPMSIKEFYTGRNIFMTGGTGFMGKVIIEKLLRSIPDIGDIYFLVRTKKNKTSDERKQDILSSPVFDLLRETSPASLEKLQVIPGEITQPFLGISEENQAILAEKVSVAFHVAAAVRFDNPLALSFQMNVKGVQNCISVVKKMTNLVSFVHVSTAYSNCNLDNIEECVYPPKISPERIEEICNWMTEEQLEMITPTLLDERPNAYTFTKSLAEYILLKEAAGLPTAIFRPSIIGAARREPTPGWIDCYHGPTGIMMAVGKGVLRVMRVDPDGIADIVPVDATSNMLIAIGWKTGIHPTTQPAVYHCTSGGVNPCTWRMMYYIVVPYMHLNPYQEIFRRPYCIEARPRSWYPYWSLIYHGIPSFLFDIILWISGKKPQMWKLYQKIDKALGCVDYFTQREWTWSTTNHTRLWNSMTEEEKKTYNFDVSDLDWNDYYSNYLEGIRKFIFKEDLAKMPQARQRYKRLRNIRYTFNLVMFLVASRIIYLKFETARLLWAKLSSMCIKMVQSIGLNMLTA